MVFLFLELFSKLDIGIATAVLESKADFARGGDLCAQPAKAIRPKGR
jgi:hypothetical protein